MRTRLFALMMALLLLAGCSAGKEQVNRFGVWQTGLSNAASISFAADLTADYGEKVLLYGARLHWSDGNATVEICSPESIAGITLHTSDDGATLEYDGASLELGSLNDTGLSPATALPAILHALKNGRLLDSRSEREGDTRFYVYTLAAESGELSVWFSGDTFAPVSCDLSDGGHVRISCKISDWNVEEQLT